MWPFEHRLWRARYPRKGQIGSDAPIAAGSSALPTIQISTPDVVCREIGIYT